MFGLFKRKATFPISSNYGRFYCKGNETILDAALKHHIVLPHNCRMGVCRQCEVTINDELHLACQYIPASEVTLDYKNKWENSRLLGSTVLERDIFEIQVENPTGRIEIIGKYIDVALPHNTAQSRKYSLVAVTPSSITLHIRKHPRGLMSQQLTSATPGKKLLISAARGEYTLPSDIACYQHVYAIANGTGMGVTLALLSEITLRLKIPATVISITRSGEFSD